MAKIVNPLIYIKGGGEIPTPTPADGKYLCQIIDYDGTVLKSERHNEGDTFTLLDEFPTHERLIAQQYSSPVETQNDLTSAKNSVVVENSDIIIGVTYTTKSGNTEFDITLTKVTGLTVTLQNLTGMTEIDWGDGTTDSELIHTYDNYGDYMISVSDVTKLGVRIFNQSSVTLQSFNFYCTDVRLSSSIFGVFDAFELCQSLTSITIPNSVKNITGFDDCYSLKSITIPNSISSQIGSYRNCYSLKSIVIPNVTISGNYSPASFSSCYSLETVHYPKKDTEKFGDVSEFNSCYSLTSIDIPENTTIFGTSGGSNNGFENCYSLIKYNFSNLKSIPVFLSPGINTMFTNINKIAKIIVADNLYDEWITATNWAIYADYIYKASEVTE